MMMVSLSSSHCDRLASAGSNHAGDYYADYYSYGVLERKESIEQVDDDGDGDNDHDDSAGGIPKNE
jgi:hypothetical protein